MQSTHRICTVKHKAVPTLTQVKLAMLPQMGLPTLLEMKTAALHLAPTLLWLTTTHCPTLKVKMPASLRSPRFQALVEL